MIYCILGFFQEHIPKMDSFPMLFSHPTRPPVRPSARHGSQVIKMSGFPVFPGSKLNQNDWFSSISRFKTESKWFVFQYFQFPKLVQHYLFQELIYFSSNFSFSINYTVNY